MSDKRLVAVGMSERGAAYRVYIEDMEAANESDYEAGWRISERLQPYTGCMNAEQRRGWRDCRNERLMELWRLCRYDYQG